MATHPICDDPSATDDRGSRGVYLRSNEVAIRLSPKKPDRMERDARMGPNDLARQAASEDVHIELIGS